MNFTIEFFKFNQQSVNKIKLTYTKTQQISFIKDFSKVHDRELGYKIANFRGNLTGNFTGNVRKYFNKLLQYRTLTKHNRRFADSIQQDIYRI